ncbi:MAG: hypothetical protein FJY98_01210 [Candidatus Liptonbacteria bacterium]|nr:hypothetical protein [Candidatus Liptonbacteria bacterium]
MAKFTKWAAPVVSTLLPMITMAQGSNPRRPAGGSEAPAPITTLGGAFDILCNVLGWIFILLIVLAVFFVIVAAFRYLMAGGEPEKVGAANHTLIYAAVAVVVAIIARGIPIIIANFFNVGVVGTVC